MASTTNLLSWRWLLLLSALFWQAEASGQAGKLDSLRRALERASSPAERAAVLNGLAEQQAIEAPGQAIERAREALALARQHRFEGEEAQALRWLAAASFYQGQPDAGLRYGQQFARLATRRGDQEGQVFAQKLMAYCSEAANRPDSALHYFQEYYRLAIAFGKKQDAASALNSQGVVAYSIGRLQEALQYYQMAGAQYQQLRDTAMLALIYNNIGTLYRDLGQPAQAMESLFAGLAIAEQAGNAYHTNLAAHNIGLVHWGQKNYDKALAYLRRAIAIEDPQLRFIRANDYSAMGAIYFEMGQLDSAGHYYQIARQAAEEANNQRLIASVANQQAVLALEQGQIGAAARQLELSQTISQELGLAKELAATGYSFGRLYLETGQPRRAIQVLEKALALADSIGYAEARLTALGHLALAYRQTGQFEAAHGAAQAIIALQDSLHEAEKTRQIAELEARYQNAQKEQLLAEQSLALEQKARANQQLLLGSLVALLLLLGAFQFWRYRMKLKRKETELALSLKAAEAENLKALDAVKSRFFANISHEFRTPLALILGPLKKAQEQLPASEQGVFENSPEEVGLPVRHLGMMCRNAERLQQLIGQLLDLSKLENGSMKLQAAKGDLPRFLRAMVLSFESLAERQRILFQTEFPAEGQKAWFDRDKLEKIIVNLLSNAFKHTPAGGLVAVQAALEGGRLHIAVADSGPGIAAEDLDKIFERFYQVEGTESRGTGIGLSLAKELVALHRGQIGVESAPGQGTVFKVELPAAREAFAADEIAPAGLPEAADKPSLPLPALLPEAAAYPGHAAVAPAGLPLLLIVEDNLDLRLFIAETMQGEYQILIAENGKAGWEAALKHTPELIVTDVMMPGMDGFELCGKLKTDERTSHIPIILLTAKAGQAHKLEGLEAGADAYLTKPFDEKELRVRARNLVEQRRKLQQRFAGPADLARFGQMASLGPSKVCVASADERFLKKVSAAIEANLDNEFFSVEDLAAAVAFSRSQLHRKLKAITGKSPTDLVRDFRLARAKELLEKGFGNVSEVAIAVGYNSLSYFTRSFKQVYGMAPSEAAGRGG